MTDYFEAIITLVCAIAIVWIINYNDTMGD
jgi:hypothetical protein